VHTILHDRYRLGEFWSLSRDFIPNSAIDQRQLGTLLSRSEITFVSSRELHRPLVRAIPLRVQIESSTSANVGRTLVDLDVELRRCSSLLITGSNRPTRNNHATEVISAKRGTSISLVVAVANEPFNVATLRPLDFALLLDWCWSHRLNRTRTRLSYEELDPVKSWQRIVETASLSVERNERVELTMRVAISGVTNFSFTSLDFNATPSIAMLTVRDAPSKELSGPETM